MNLKVPRSHVVSYIITFLNFSSSIYFSLIVYRSDLFFIEFYTFILIVFNVFSIFEFGLVQKFLTQMKYDGIFWKYAQPMIFSQFLLSMFLFLFLEKDINLIAICIGLIFRSLSIMLYNKILISGDVYKECYTRFWISSGYQILIFLYLLLGYKIHQNILAFSIFLSYISLFVWLISEESKPFRLIKVLKFDFFEGFSFKFFLLNFCSFYLFAIPLTANKLYPTENVVKFSLFLQILNLFVQFSMPFRSILLKKIRLLSNEGAKVEMKKFAFILITLLITFKICFNSMKEKIYEFLNLKISLDDFLIIADFRILLIVYLEIVIGFLVFYALQEGIKLFWVSALITSVIISINYYFFRNDFKSYLNIALATYIICLYIPNLYMAKTAFVVSFKKYGNITHR